MAASSAHRLRQVAIVVSSFCGVQWVYDNVGYVAKVEGCSMQPVLNPDPTEDADLVALRRINGAFDDLRRGDIVTAACPYSSSEVYIKRVVGLAGDLVEPILHRSKKVRVPKGHCWIEGDNHRKSIDSNEFGPVPLGLIQSKAVGVLWPSDRRQFLTHEISQESAKRVTPFTDEKET